MTTPRATGIRPLASATGIGVRARVAWAASHPCTVMPSARTRSNTWQLIALSVGEGISISLLSVGHRHEHRQVALMSLRQNGNR